ILFGTIPTTIPDTTPFVTSPTTHIDTTPIPTVSPTIPPSPDYTPASPDYSPASDTEFDRSEDPSSDHIPLLPATSSFLSSTDDSSDSDIPDTPPSPTYGTPFIETTLSTQRSPIASGALRCRVMVLAHGQPILHVDYSSSDHFSLDDSLRDSSSSSLSESSLDSFADALCDSASSRSSFGHSLPTPSSGMRPSHHLCSLVPSIHRSSAAISERPSHDSSSVSLSHKRSRSPATFIPLSSPTLGALSYACADLLPSPKRIRSPETATDLEGCSDDSIKPYVPREARLGVDFKDESSEPSRHRGTDLEMDVDVVRSDGIDINPEIQADIDECITYADALRDRGIDARVVVEAIDREEIKTSIRGLVEVRVDRVTHPVVADDIPEPAQEGAVEVTYETLGDLFQMFHDHTKEILVRRVQLEQDNRRLRDMMDLARQCLSHDLEHQGHRRGWSRGGNGNGGNRNGNGNVGGNSYNFRGFVHVRECTYQDFLKCQPLSFNGTEGLVGLTSWFEKMETVFHISNCPEKYQVKYASCMLLNSALTWWNSHKRTIGIEATYVMKTELWNLVVKGNDLTAYTRRFQELVLLCTRMVPNEEDKVERFVGGLPDNIQGNVIAAEPTKL
ncbi:hypothetical protein Tco_1084425, partial [Tanacetum coccineum]